MATLAELAGVKPADNIDSISFVPTLLGEAKIGKPQKQHEYLYWEYLNQRAVRMGNWKAVRPTSDTTNWELYNLSTDIEEKNDIGDANPTILAQMVAYAAQAHTTHTYGQVLDSSLVYNVGYFR
ncbi:MAG: hypothetical protein JEZ07_14870 [Phycisphaerae bacterium]|nr:hypothetical protein [Phycisphaerae bacterium]